MSWFALTLLSVFISSLANILQKVLMRGEDSSPTANAVIFHFVLGFLNLIFTFIHGFQTLPLNGTILLFFIASALWGAGTIFLFKALQLLESSEVVILSSIKTIVTIGASILFLSEVFDMKKALGAFLILSSIGMVTIIKKGVRLNEGGGFALLSAVFYGTAVVFDAAIIKNYDPITYLSMGNILIGCLLLLWYPKTLSKAREFIHPQFLKKIIPLGVFSSTQAIAYYYALQIGQASQIASINQSGVIVTIIFAIILLKERDHLSRKLIAAVLVTVGVVLLR